MPDIESVLNPMAPKNPAQQVLSSANEEPKKDKEYIEGAETIPLPSKGVFYTWNKDFWNMLELQVRQLNYTDEDILTTRQYFENGTLFNELLKNVIVDPNQFPATGLVPIDRDTILLWLRTTAFGKDFEVQHNCPSCEQSTSITWDISTLDIPTYPDEVYEELKNNGEYTIETPLKDLKVKVVVPTIGKSLETEKRLAAKKTAHKVTNDFFGTGSLMLIVAGVEIEGRVIRDKQQIEQHFKKINLPLSDARYIRKEAEKLNLKYDTKKDVTCSNCNHVTEGVEMPIVHPNFFWPDAGL